MIISHDLTGGDGVIIIIIIIESEVCRKVLPRFIRVIGLNRHNGGGEKEGMKDKKKEEEGVGGRFWLIRHHFKPI